MCLLLYDFYKDIACFITDDDTFLLMFQPPMESQTQQVDTLKYYSITQKHLILIKHKYIIPFSIKAYKFKRFYTAIASRKLE